MTIRSYRESTNSWPIAKRVRFYRSSIENWADPSKISVYRNPSLPFWDIIYPDLPAALSTPLINGTGEVGSSFSVDSLFFWDFDYYRLPTSQTFQWQRSTSSGGPWTNRGSISSSYSNYQIQSDDVGYFFRLQIIGTNAKGSTVVNSASSVMANDPNYIFTFDKEFGVNANAQIILDPDSNGNFYDNSLALTGGRGLNYFFGDYKHFNIWYRSDLTNFRIYHQLYRNDRTTRPSTPDIEYEIVFTNNSNIVDIYVVNPIATSYIESYAAYLRGFTVYKSYNSANYAAGQRFRVTLDGTTPISVSAVPASTTAPSSTNGWISISEDNDSTVGTTTFSLGINTPSPTNRLNFFGPFNAFNKSNMYYPKQVSSITPTYLNSTQATVSWTYNNLDPLRANSFVVQVMSSDNSTVLSTSASTTSTSTTISSLTVGTTYNIRVYSNSRSGGDGQSNIPLSVSYTHAGVPSAPTNVVGTAGNAQVALTWTAPSSNGSAITGYRVRHSSNGGVSWSSPIATGSTSTSYTVTGLTNGTSYIFQVLAINSIGDGPWSSSSSSITPQIVATKIAVTVSSTPIETFNTSTITAQLQDASNNNVSQSGVTINFALDAAPVGSLSASSATTNANGSASVTFTAGATAGVDAITASSTGLSSGVGNVTVNLRAGISFTLTGTGTARGVSFSKSVNDANYTYTSSGPIVGSLESGDSYANSQFDILVPVLFNVRPTVNVTRNATNGSATCDMTPGGTSVYTINRTTSVTVNATRSGYASTSATGTGTSARTLTSRSFQWQQFTGGAWNTNFGAAFSGAATQTLNWSNNTFSSRQIRCRVDSTFSDGTTDTLFTSNEPTIP